MKCPFCGSEKTKVVDKRFAEDDFANRRRRECLDCGKRFTTYERLEAEKGVKIPFVKKRDGRLVPFKKEKIIDAIFKAAQSVGGKDKELATRLAEKVIENLNQRFDETNIPSVEDVSDTIEQVLIKEGHAKTAKAFILYRETRARQREAKLAMLDVSDAITAYIHQRDWRVKENSNEEFSFSGLVLYVSGKVMATYALNEIYPPQISMAHKLGYMHIHDLGHPIIGYCCGHSLKNLLLMGFGGVRNKTEARPAKHLSTVIRHMVNYIGCLQMEFAGAQAFSGVDTLLAPFIKVDSLSYKEVKQCIQELVYGLNIPSRWGAQYPFSNLTFDLVVPDFMQDEKAIVGGKRMPFTYAECQDEMSILNKAFLEVLSEGDAHGKIFTFPIPTYNLTKDFDWNSEIADMLFEVTAKYGSPYFQNYIGSGLNPRSIYAMCCRLNMDLTQLMNRPGGMWSMGDSTGSIGVVTINMNRIGYESKSESEFFEKLEQYMILAKDSLEIKRKIIEQNLQRGLMPYTKVYLGTFRNHFSTIGLVGMNEACLNFRGEDISTQGSKRFTVAVLKFMREKILEFQQETGNLYNLEATPAESAAFRLAMLDKKMYKDIIVSGDKTPFLTNSTQLPVDKTKDLLFALDHQNDIQPLYTGGTIFHTFLGERVENGESCKRLVKKIAYNTKLPYFSITPTFSICKVHGYLHGEHWQCPRCGKPTEVYSRIVGYFRPVQNWNAGKQEEFKYRKTFDYKPILKEGFPSKIEKAIAKTIA